MSLQNLNMVFGAIQNECLKISLQDVPNLSETFKQQYTQKIEHDTSFSRHNRISWDDVGTAELWSRNNNTRIYLSPVSFVLGLKLVPLYGELIAYRDAIVNILGATGATLKTVSEVDCVPYINASTSHSEVEKAYLVKFVTDGAWWGKGRAIARAQDFFESPLMQCAKLTQETQSEIARVAKQLYENPSLKESLESSFAGSRVGKEGSMHVHRRYWLIAPGEGANYWDDWIRGGIATIGWPFLGDLTTKDRKTIQAEIDAEAGDGKAHTNNSLCCWQFGHEMSIGDVVIAKSGTRDLLGLGFADGEYAFGDACGHHKHYRKVRWIKTGNFKSQVVLDRKTLTDITPYPDYLLKILESMGIDPLTLNDKPEQEPELEDVLEFALLQFKMHRGDPEWAGNRGENDWTSWSVNTATREYYSKLSAEKVHVFTREQFVELFCGVKNEAGKITFSPMWSGCPGQGWNSVKEGYEENPQKVISFLEDIAKSPAILSLFTRDDFERPKGFGKSVISELLMKFHPDCCFKYGSKTVEVLKKLGLLDFVPHSDYKDTEYKRVLGIAATIKDKMTDLKITRTPEDSEKPDYLTVNEFVGWVFDQKDELFKIYKEKVMSKKLKTDKPTPYAGTKELKFDPAVKDDELLLRLLASLRAKPFAILAGHSGTGKSRYVKKLAYMTCNAQELRAKDKLPGNYLLLQVKPNWHDSTELLGIRNAMDENRYQRTALIEFLFKAYHFKDTPFFLCLDEMNLAPVEQYFAEFLSAMESEEPVPLNDIKEDEDNLFELGCEWTDALEYVKENGFSIPNNLFIVGTVNMDETTNQFSRKVLDRAFTIEMTDVDFTKFGVVTKPSYDDTIGEDMIKALLSGEKSVTKLDNDDVADGSALVKVQKMLEQTAFAIAYRFASEYTLLKRAIKLFDPGNTMKLDALDQAVLMKVLPRIAGEADYIRRVYGKTEGEGLRKALEGKKVSLEKIAVILKRAEEADAQSITFWP